MFTITRATIPSLFGSFVLGMKAKETVLENYLLLRNVLILDLCPYFISFSAIMPESDLKQQMI